MGVVLKVLARLEEVEGKDGSGRRALCRHRGTEDDIFKAVRGGAVYVW